MNSTALSTQAAASAPAKAHVATGGVLSALVPQTLDEAFRLATALAGSGDMVPKAFQGQPQATMAAIIRGMEVGLAPMQALASIAVINGRASIWGDALPALMQRAGHHIDVDVTGEGDAMLATATLTRGDTGKKIVRTFSAADAKAAGLWGKQGPWQTHKKRMLGNKARNFAVRDGAADAMMGMAVADQEDHQGPDAARDITPQATAPRRGGVVYADADPVVDEIYDAPLDTRPSTATDAELSDAAAREQAELDRAEREFMAARERGQA